MATDDLDGARPLTEGFFVESLRELLDDPRMPLSQQALADAMRERGHRFHQATIYKILNGERKITLGEALDIADIVELPLEEMIAPRSNVARRVVRAVRAYEALAAERRRLAERLNMAEDEVATALEMLSLTGLTNRLEIPPTVLRTAEEILERRRERAHAIALNPRLWEDI